jgi:DUF1009 family protein
MPIPEATRQTASHPGQRNIAILAGSGLLPIEIAEALERAGCTPHIVAINGSADDRLARWPITRVGIAQVGGMIAAMSRAGCKELIIAGGTRRPDVLGLRIDFGTLRYLPDILGLMRGGDDSLLRRVVRFFEKRGLRVLGVPDVAPSLMAEVGLLGGVSPAGDHEAWIAAARHLLLALSPYDVGQAAVVNAGGVVAIEGADGTDAMLKRLAGRVDARGGVLVKLPKRGQEMRVDLPAIGPDTVRRATEIGLAGIAVGAGGTIVLGRAEALALADAAGVFVLGLPTDNPTVEPQRRLDERTLLPVSKRWPSPGQRQDARIGAAIVAILAAHGAGRLALVVRQHVLAVSDFAGMTDLLDRGRRIRPWGLRLLGRRGGVMAILPDPQHTLVAADVEAIAAARLAGVVVDGPLGTRVGAAADLHGLFAVRLAQAGSLAGEDVDPPAPMRTIDRG